MNFTPEQNQACALASGYVVDFVYDYDDGVWDVFYTDEQGTDIAIPLSNACSYFGEPSQPQLAQDPVGWTFESVGDVVDGLGGVVTSVLGIFGLFNQPQNNNAAYNDPNYIDQSNDAKATRMILGFAALVGLILVGVRYLKK